jgi:methionyl-tRNA formyltransferase
VYHNGKQIKIFSCTISDLKKKGIPGKVVGKTKTDFSVACNEGVISVREVQLEGKRRMPVRDFFNGYTINIGDSLY